MACALELKLYGSKVALRVMGARDQNHLNSKVIGSISVQNITGL